MKQSVKFMFTFCVNIWHNRWQEIIGILAYYCYEAMIRGFIVI